MGSLLYDRRLYSLLIGNIVSSIGSGVTMIGVPWLLINRAGGEHIYGYSALIITLFMFLVSPHIGVIIDRFPRKRLLLAAEMAGFGITASFALTELSTGDYATWQLIAIYFGGVIYSGLHYPAQYAFTQELFSRSQYQSLNGVMEIQGQTASMIAGGLASFAIDKIPLSYILAADAATYIAGFILIASIPYQAHARQTELQKATVWSNMKEGFRYLQAKPLLLLFFISSQMPFIAVMVGNYLYPVYIAKILQADATVMGMYDAMYAVGAIAAGLTIPWMMKRYGSFRSTAATVAIYTLMTLLIVAVPVIPVFLLLNLGLGCGNAGTRVARNTIMMELVRNDLIGRVNSFFTGIGYGLRVSLIALFTQITVHAGAVKSLMIMGCLLIAAFAGVIASRSAIMPKSEQGAAGKVNADL